MKTESRKTAKPNRLMPPRFYQPKPILGPQALQEFITPSADGLIEKTIAQIRNSIPFVWRSSGHSATRLSKSQAVSMNNAYIWILWRAYFQLIKMKSKNPTTATPTGFEFDIHFSSIRYPNVVKSSKR